MADGQLPKGLSPSSIDLYRQCPRRFKVEKVDGGYAPAGRPALLGTFVHRVLELVMEKDPAERTIEAAKACAREAWPETEEHDDFKLLELPDGDAQRFRWEGWGSVERYFEMESPSEVVVLSTEKFVRVTVGTVPMTGIIDRLDREGDDLIITDYKNGKVPLPRYRDSKWRQLNFYAAMIEARDGERPTEGRLIFTAHSEILTTQFTDDSVTDAINVAEETWTAIHRDFEADSWEPSPGPLCGWCSVVDQCPEGLAETRLRYLQGRLKETAPAYPLVAN